MSHLIDLRKIAISLAMFAIVAFGSSVVARADAVSYNLNVGSTLPSQQYGTVDLVLNGDNSITLTFTLINGNKIIETGQGIAIGFNSSLSPNPSVTVAGLPAGYTFDLGSPGAFGADGFGTFEYAIHSQFNVSDQASALGTVSFTVSKTGGFASVFDLVSNSVNPPGDIESFFAVDIWCPTCNGGVGATGFIGTGGSAIPEPASMLLLGTGLVGLAAGLRRRMHR